MARRNTLDLTDMFPFTITSASGEVDSQSIQAPHADPSASASGTQGGTLPWGCEPRDPADRA